jgi:hypothetical protein
VGVRGLQQLAPHIEENLGHWGREGHKKGGKPGHRASHGKEMQKNTGVAVHSRSCTPNAGYASRDQTVYWCCSSNIFGSQLVDHFSDIILFRVFSLLI